MNEEKIQKLQEKYRLTEKEYDDYLKKVIFYFTCGKTSVLHPKLVFVAGQPGAGKSKLIPVVNKQT